MAAKPVAVVTAPDLDPREFLNRIVYDPDWIKDGKLIPNAVSTQDLAGRGASVNRDFVTEKVLRRQIADGLARKPENFGKVARLSLEDVARLQAVVPNRPKGSPTGQQVLFKVEKSPRPADRTKTPPTLENRAHAHIICMHSGEGTIRELRNLHLIPLLQNIVSVEESLRSGKAAWRKLRRLKKSKP